LNLDITIVEVSRFIINLILIINYLMKI